MDAIVMLRADHKKVERMFKAFEKGDLSVVPEITGALTVHAAIEEAYMSKAMVLMEMVRHHVKEEEDELFAKVRSELGRNRLLELGEEILVLQATLTGQPA
jgi:thiazole synthase ThiGH ThiG subunit